MHPRQYIVLFGTAVALGSGCASEASEVAQEQDELPVPEGGEQNLQIGEFCLPGDEWFPEFSSYAVKELNIQDDHAACASSICLINHFRGRTNCPYGQAAPSDPVQLESPVCTLPDGRARVAVEVAPQFVDRRAEDTVYCSCRCDGPEGAGPFCACPSGFECQPLVDPIGPGRGDEYAGSYCIKAGTAYDEFAAQEACDWNKKNCGPG